MKTFKEHILEKLKVTKFSGYGIPTYQEYFKLLDMYCASTKKGFLDLVKMHVFDNDLLPKYENDESKYICRIIPIYSNNIRIIRLNTYDFTLEKTFSYDIHINSIKDKEVDFMSSEAVENTVKYMQEAIKK